MIFYEVIYFLLVLFSTIFIFFINKRVELLKIKAMDEIILQMQKISKLCDEITELYENNPPFGLILNILRLTLLSKAIFIISIKNY